ncbi:pol polyprotein [Trichonephila clavipes]|nr:pol polyprotein [Trichonephila clavipes]
MNRTLRAPQSQPSHQTLRSNGLFASKSSYTNDAIKPSQKSRNSPSNATAYMLATNMVSFVRLFPETLAGESAELVYDKTLRLPGEFFIETKAASDPVQFVERLRAYMQHLQPQPTRSRVRRPLQAPYDGPFNVIKRSDKFYKVNIHDKPTSISIDRLKPAFTHNVDDTLHLEKSDAETKPNVRKTRSGHRVHFPDYFVSSR